MQFRFGTAASLLLLALGVSGVSAQSITTVAGGGSDDVHPPTAIGLNAPSAVALDHRGIIYIVDQGNNIIRRYDRERQVVVTVAGNGSAGFAGDGGPATAAALNGPVDIAFDASGNLYIADAFNDRIRAVDANGVIRTIAGVDNPSYGSGGDGGPATRAQLYYPSGLAFDRSGALLVADAGNNRIRRIENGKIETIVGNGFWGTSPDGVPATSAALKLSSEQAREISVWFPRSLVLDSLGDIYFADVFTDRVRKYNVTSKLLSTVAGTGVQGFSGDGGPATRATLFRPSGLVFRTPVDLVVTDYRNRRIREVNLLNGVIRTIAGNGELGYSGDGGAATSATLAWPAGLAVDGNGTLFVAEVLNSRVRSIRLSDGRIDTAFGNGQPYYPNDGQPATAAQLLDPVSVSLDAGGNLFIVDRAGHRVRKVDAASGVISTVAGTGIAGYSGDGDPATQAKLSSPSVVACARSGDVYILDGGNSRVRRIDPSGTITTVAGNGSQGEGVDGVDARNSPFRFGTDVAGLAINNTGDLFISDSRNNRIRKVSAATGVISTVAGGGAEYADGGPATASLVSNPTGLAFDSSGNLYVGESGFDFDTRGERVRRVSTEGTIQTVAGFGGYGFEGDNGPAINAKFRQIAGIAIDAFQRIWIADSVNSRLRVVEPTGLIRTGVGNGQTGYAGDLGPATRAGLKPMSVAFAPDGTLYVADSYGRRVRSVAPCSAVGTPLLSFPSQGASGVALASVLLQWQSVRQATDYDIVLDRVTPPAASVGRVRGTSVAVTNLVPGTTYYWRIVARSDPNCSAQSASSEIRSFTTRQECGAVQVTAVSGSQ